MARKRRAPAAKRALVRLRAESFRHSKGSEVERARLRYQKNKTDSNYKKYTKLYDRYFAKAHAFDRKVAKARQRLIEAVQHDLRVDSGRTN